MDNYLQNRFKLDGNLYCKQAMMQQKINVMEHLKSENNEELYSLDYEKFIRAYENQNFSNDSEESDTINNQYETRSVFMGLENFTKEANKNEDLRKVFPSRNTFQFENGIEITSDFDAGNLHTCSIQNLDNFRLENQTKD